MYKVIIAFILGLLLVAPIKASETHSFIKPDLSATTTPVAKALPPPNKELKKFDTSFKIALIYNVAGVVSDHVSTAGALSRCDACYEGNTLFRRKNGNANYTANAAVSAIPIIVAVILERKGHRKSARILLYVAGSIRFGAAIHNLGISTK